MNCAFAYPLYDVGKKPSLTPLRPRCSDDDTKYSFIGRLPRTYNTAAPELKKLSNIFLLHRVCLSQKASTPTREKRLQQFKTLLAGLPLVKVRFDFIDDDPAYFFRLDLKGGVELIITQYDEENLNAAYVNVLHNNEFVFQGRVEFSDLLPAINNFYDAYPDGK